jgi:hypothetical protein
VATDSHPLASEDPPSSSKRSTYDKNLPEELTRRGVFDEILPSVSGYPKNLLAIQNAILVKDGVCTEMAQASGQEIRDYTEFCKIMASVGINETQISRRAF